MSVLLLSGGLDSAVLLARESSTGGNPVCLSFDYGQRHKKELDCAREIAQHYRSFHEVIAIPEGLMAGSALTGAVDVPHGHYEDPAQRATVVPNRNAVMISLAAARAVAMGLDSVLFAAHAGDSAIYPDCRPAFVAAMDEALRIGCGVELLAPFLGMTKRMIVEAGRRMGVPFEMTWSCYQGGVEPCGKCGACVEREEALA